MANDLSWALPRLKRLLPLDDQSLQEVLSYSSTLSKLEGAEHLKNLLGDSPQALEFISSFNSRRRDVEPEAPVGKDKIPQSIPAQSRRAPKRSKPPLHNAGPARQPEGYGNVTGGYQKVLFDQDQIGTAGRATGSETSTLSHTPEALQLPTTTSKANSTTSSRDASPVVGARKLPPSAAGSLITDFMPNVRSKQAKKPAHPTHSEPPSRSSTPHGRAVQTTTTSNISDLTKAIAALEMSTNPALSSERRRCDCNASIHPLFATAPNCLSCGKIICALEGLQPCSYCDSPVLTNDQVQSMIKALKEERGVERMAEHNASVPRSGQGTPILGPSTPESTSGDEASSAAARARAHRDKLLAFQRENAQRTKIHDEAADYDVSLTPGATQWMSPVQRAAALKKQQAYLREMEEANRPEWEKKKTVMSMSIKNGKLVKTFDRQHTQVASTQNTENEPEGVEEELEHRNDQHLSAGSGAFSNNPLLKSGKLVRPIWQPKDDGLAKGKETATNRERKSIWRRVQDENEDNEQWILDGGLRGYGIESRLMEDGSQQEGGG